MRVRAEFRSGLLAARQRGDVMRVVLAQPRGFCAGVERAIEIVERALEKYGPPIYVRHEIVHNRHVVERLRAKGAQFVDEIDEVPPGSVTIFSAHGVASEIEQRAGERGLPVIDATCPLVSKVHTEGQRASWPGSSMSCWWSARRTAPIPTVCAKSPRNAGSRAI